MDNLKFLDVAQLLGFLGSSSIIIIIISAAYIILMSFLYCTCLYNKYYNPKSKPRKYFFGRWFANMANYFV